MTMVCNNCLQEILAGESFWEDETEGPAYHEDCRQAALDRRNKAEEERDAASARAEAAEADNRRLTARVAELESQLAAQQWRPVTEDWPAQGESAPVRMRNGVIRWGYRLGDRWYLTGGHYVRESVTHAFSLPPAPQETK
jgi:glycine/D-amino acid oxidase-like deaminating enzyme